jgi:hypothetical protein
MKELLDWIHVAQAVRTTCLNVRKFDELIGIQRRRWALALPPLYKYLDVRGARLTLGTKTFKHTKPSDFNDIEDVTIKSIFPEDVEAALKRLANSFTDVIIKNLNKPPTCGAKLKDQVVLIQQIYRENPGAAEAVREAVKNDPANALFDVEHMRERSKVHLKEINDFMQDYRIFCVTTHRDSERMWTDYAENHAGIVLRIEPSTEKDSKFQLFQPVEYRTTRPPLYEDTLDFLEGSLFGNQESRIRKMLERTIYAKTMKWKHESEYRLAIPVRPGEDWNTMPYHPEEITELYLGLSMSHENKADVIAKAKAVNSNIVIFQASRSVVGALKFEELSPRNFC